MERLFSYTDDEGQRYAVPKGELQEFLKQVPSARLAGDFRDTKGNAYTVAGNDDEMGEFTAQVPDAQTAYRFRSKSGRDYVIPLTQMGDFLKAFRTDDTFKEEREEIDKRVKEIMAPKASMAGAIAKGAAEGAWMGIKDAGRGVSRAFTDQIPGLFHKSLAVLAGKDATAFGRYMGAVARDIDYRAEQRKWDDPEVEGWAAIGPGAFESVITTLVPAIATGGASAYAMPALYGLGRSFDVHEEAIKSGHSNRQAIVLAAGAGAIEGGMEYVSMLWGGGKQSKDIAKALTGEQLEKNARDVLKSLAKEALTEAGTEGLQEGIGNQYDQLAAGDDIDYRQSLTAAGMGAGTGAVAAFLQGGPMAAQEIHTGRGRVSPYTPGTSPQELAAWTIRNPEKALALAGKDAPSRKDFEAAGLPRVSAGERARIASDLKELATEEGESRKSRGRKGDADLTLGDPSLILDDGTVFGSGEIVPKGTYMIGGEQVILPDDTPASQVLANQKAAQAEAKTEPDKESKPETPPAQEQEPETASESSASAPLLITREMRAGLRELGFKRADIEKMTPEQAWDILNTPQDQELPPEPVPDIIPSGTYIINGEQVEISQDTPLSDIIGSRNPQQEPEPEMPPKAQEPEPETPPKAPKPEPETPPKAPKPEPETPPKAPKPEPETPPATRPAATQPPATQSPATQPLAQAEANAETADVKPLPQTRENAPAGAPKESGATTPPKAEKPAEGRKSGDTAVLKEALTAETPAKPTEEGKTIEKSSAPVRENRTKVWDSISPSSSLSSMIYDPAHIAGIKKLDSEHDIIEVLSYPSVNNFGTMYVDVVERKNGKLFGGRYWVDSSSMGDAYHRVDHGLQGGTDNDLQEWLETRYTKQEREAKLKEWSGEKAAKPAPETPPAQEQEPEPKPAPKAADLASISDEDLDALMDQAAAEIEAERKPRGDGDVIGQAGEWVEDPATGEIGQITHSGTGKIGVQFPSGLRWIERGDLNRANKPVEKKIGKKGVTKKTRPVEAVSFVDAEGKVRFKGVVPGDIISIADKSDLVFTGKTGDMVKFKDRQGVKGWAWQRDIVSVLSADKSVSKNADIQTAETDTGRVPREIIESAAKHGVKGIEEAAQGLYELFGANKRLGMGVTFDENTYAKARPHFQAALNHFSEAGKDAVEFIKWAMTEFGDGIRPYLKRFKNELAEGGDKHDNRNDGGQHHDDAGNRETDPGGSPEGTQVGAGDRRPGSGEDAGSLEDHAPEDAGGTPQAGSGQAAGTASRGEGTGGTVRPDGGVPSTDGRPGAGGAQLVPDRARGGREPRGATGLDTADDRGGREPAVRQVQPNYRIRDPEALVGGGPKDKFSRNRKAIETYLAVKDAGRAPTEAERDAIAAYIGWGSFGQELFKGTWERPDPKKGWEAEDAQLREHLGREKWESAQRSIINAHYTNPPTVTAMWDMVRRMGFRGGRVLEPSMGIGNFFGLMPADLAAKSDLTGIELDELTGGMAQMLYPQANISIKGYQDSQTPDGFYDLVIGNWPFAAQGPADRRYNKLSPTLHDYFFLKALDQVRPGGLVVGITSAGTMDKLGQQARLEMSKKAALVASFRLPMGAFKSYAGTDVVTDIIILRKHDADLKGIPVVPRWVSVSEMKTPAGVPVRVNNYYHDNPDHILGRLNYGTGTTSPRPGMIVEATRDFEQRLENAINSVPKDIMRPPETRRIRYVTNNSDDRVNSIMVGKNGELLLSQGEQAVMLEDQLRITVKDAKKTEQRRQQIRDLVAIRKLHGQIIDQQREGAAQTETTRAELRKAYEAFVKQYGAINDSFALAQMKKVGDPNYAAVASLERNTAKPGDRPRYVGATILTRSTTRARPRPEVMKVGDAYVFQRNEALELDMARIAELAKTTEEQVIGELLEAGAIFALPAGGYEHADVYLSGNIRLKLNDAKAAKAAGVEGMDRNIAAIEKLMPADIPYYNIEAKLGNNWTTPEHYKAFVGEMIGVTDPEQQKRIEVVFSPQGWKVRLPRDMENRSEANTNFGHEMISFGKLAEHAMRSTPATIRTRGVDGNWYVDEKLTEEVNEKISAIQEHFATWVWKDPVRRVELERTYNEIYNNSVSPQYSGDFLAFEGMMLERGNSPFDLRSHQIRAIARGLISGRGIYAHEVGTGKTYTMAGIAIESRRYGKCKKPILFAHNANSATVAAEINEMYPGAKVLYVDNLAKSTRDVTLAQITNDDWDVIVVPHSMIDKFALRDETYKALAAEEIAELEAAAIEAATEDGVSLHPGMMDDEKSMAGLRSPTAKELVKARNKIIERINKMAQRSAADAIRLEDAGIDMILVDEAHEFKKPPIATSMRMKGLNKQASDRSINMMFLLQYIAGINSGRGVHLFTGTPITNTLNEIYNMMRFVMPNEMKQAGVAHWDTWFNTFANETTDVEVTAAGDYEPTTRLASFVNVPELRAMVGQYMDVVFADEMPEFEDRKTESGKTLKDPALTDAERDFLLNGRTENPTGRPYKIIKTVVSEMTEGQSSIRAWLQERAMRFRNMTKKARRQAMLEGSDTMPIRVETDAAKAGLDARLYDRTMPDEPTSKVNTAIGNILQHYAEHPQACQVIFMERGFSDYVTRTEKIPDTKSVKRYREPAFNLTKDIVGKLVKQGIPADQIAIVDGSVSKLKRKAIADDMRSGKIRVVIGSTDTLGTGVNMQDNLRAIHHLDAPWRPGDLEQRNGRGWRQGNKWNSVIEYRYVTSGIDGRRWQVLVVKSKFILDFLKNRGNQRVIEGDAASIEDDSGGNDLVSTLSEATGDPRILMIEKAKRDVDRLQRRERLFVEGQADTQFKIKDSERRKSYLGRMIEYRRDVEKLLAKDEGKPFSVTLNGQVFDKRSDADKHLAKIQASFTSETPVSIGTYKGFTLKAAFVREGFVNPKYVFKLIAEHPGHRDLSLDASIASYGTLMGLDAVLRNNKDRLEAYIYELNELNKTNERLAKSLDETFPQQAQLEKTITRLEMLETDLRVNPVPPPAWLRQETPVGSSVIYNGEPRAVAGHKWSDNGWYVLLEPAIEGGELEDASYTDVIDEQGMPIYEERPFEPPVVIDKQQAQAKNAAAEEDGADKQGYADAGYTEDARPARDIGARRQDGTEVTPQPTQPTRIIDTIRKLWPGLSVRSRATWTQTKHPAWYVNSLGEMRLTNAGDIIKAVHELGHHFDRELGRWSKQTGLASGIPGELIALGRELYGDTVPSGGYRAEGFAEFIGQYLTGGDIQSKAPNLYNWFTTEYLQENPREARKLRELEDVIAQFQIQTPEQAMKALMSPRRVDWSGQRVAATLVGLESQVIDSFMPLLRGMMETGAKVMDIGTGEGQIRASEHPYMLAIYFARTAGGRALNALLENTTDLYGKANGESLKAIFEPVVKANKVDEFIWYWIARRAITRYHEHGLVSGIARQDAQAIIDKYQSAEWDNLVARATDWAHRELHLLVEAGAMTQDEFDKIVDMNPIYAPMMRQFLESEKRKGGKSRGKGVHRVKGGQQPFVDPLTALAQQSERLHQVAMQHAIMRALVKFYDTHVGKVPSMGKFMSEVPAPLEAVTFSLEKIKKTVLAKAAELGADPDAITPAMLEETWDELATIFRPRKDYKGGDHIVAFEIDGKRRFFEIQPDLLPILEGVTRSQFLGDGKIAELFRGATALQRLGATGLNPAFGIIRNPIRDTATAAVFADYHFHIPLISTITGMVMDIANADYAKMYHAAGLDIAGFYGQSLRSARKAGRRVTAKNKAQSIARAGLLDGLVEILGHSEVGPRLMEYRGAFKYAKKMGWDDQDALVLAGCASKDVTVNFSRAGTEVRKVNEMSLFTNAAFQSIDKLGRSMGVRQAMPWAKHRNVDGSVSGEIRARLKTAGRTTARALAYITVAALMNYIRNRDKEWWKKLPAFEKWNYLHVGNLNGDGCAFRIPLPFEIGSLFGALPVAMLEEKRAPGAFKEAMQIAIENSSPFDIGLGEDDFRHKVAAVVRNFSLFTGAGDILVNEDWKGSAIVPRYLEGLEPDLQYTHDTTSVGKLLGKHLGIAPAQVDHLLNTYTGQLYKRVYTGIQNVTGQGSVDIEDKSSWPVIGTLFLRPNTSRVVSDFYDRLDELERRYNSDRADGDESHELKAMRKVSGRLTKLWRARRKALEAGGVEGRRAANDVVADVQALIEQHNEVWSD